MKRGPNTAEGRVISARNSLTHGITAKAVVLPGIEDPSDWEVHCDGVLESLMPVGYLETELAERVAMLLWRLRRVQRYEQTATSTRHASKERKVARLLSRESTEVQERTHWVHEALRVMAQEQEQENSRTEPLPWQVAGLILGALGKVTGEKVPAVGKEPWTVDRLLSVCLRLCSNDPGASVRLWRAAVNSLVHASAEMERGYTMLARVQTSVLPAPKALETIRYHETHLERCLGRTLGELRKLQQDRTAISENEFTSIPLALMRAPLPWTWWPLSLGQGAVQ